MVTKYSSLEVAKEYCSITKKMVEDILNVPLTFPGSPTFTLADVKDNFRQHEQAFLFEFKNQFGTGQLRDIIKKYSKNHFDIEENPTGNLAFDGGFLNGFIDLVFQYNNKFYIIDWKSNSIDGNMENFKNTNLSREIVTKSYHVQYILYTVALTRQLQAALSNGNREYKITKEEYDKYFGGVAYLFLRGIKKEDSQTGIFIDRPSFEEISLINNLFGE
jgi:exodeoxyribonuclease V beta subunit